MCGAGSAAGVRQRALPSPRPGASAARLRGVLSVSEPGRRVRSPRGWPRGVFFVARAGRERLVLDDRAVGVRSIG